MKNNKTVGLISLYAAENYGIKILSSILRRNGYRIIEVYFKDWKNNYLERPTKYEIANLIKILKQYDVTLVGISVRASGFMDIAVFITDEIKKKLNLPVMWGGMHPTSMPEECIRVVDYICIGEAEDAFPEFIDKFFNNEKLNNIPNIWASDNGLTFRNNPRPLIPNLDVIPFRDFTSLDKFFIDGKTLARGEPCFNDRIYLISASRGCPYRNCSFCVIPLLNKLYRDYGGYGYRYRSVENVIKELSQVKKILPKLKRVRFDDELFITDRKWLEEFSKEYKKFIALPFDILMLPLAVNEQNLLLLKKAGLDTVIMGVQSAERINRILYNRYQPDRRLIKASKTVHGLKLKACYQLIVDDPLSSSQDKKELFELIFSLARPYELYLFSLTIYPNTPLAERLIADGHIKYDDQIDMAKKIFHQYRVDLNFKRPKEDIFWLSLLIMLSKRFIPKGILGNISKNAYFKKHPFLIRWSAEIANIFKMSYLLFKLFIRDEIDLRTLKRWFNLKSLITQ